MGQTFEEFREAMKEEVGRLLGKRALVTATNTMKLNGTMKRGITVTEKGEEDSVVLYLESAYECYKKGAPLKGLAQGLWECYKKTGRAQRRPPKTLVG